MRRKLDLYRHVLGARAGLIEEQVEPLAETMLHHDGEWYRKQRGRLGEPFAALERIVVDSHKRQLEYASRRLALAAAGEELEAASEIDRGAVPLPGREAMLAEYRSRFGARDAAAIERRANYHRQFVKQQPERLEARARRFAAPYLPRSELDEKVSEWMRENRGTVTALLALERAEERTAELERAEFEAAEGKPAEPVAAPAEAERAGVGEDAVAWLSGPEINQRIEQRKQELVPEFERLSRRQLRDEGRRLEAEVYDRGRELYEEAARLEEARAPLFAPAEEVIRRAAEAEQRAREASDQVAQRELQAKADYFRQEARADRRWRQRIEDVQSRWVDLHAREAALQLVAERGLERSHEAEGVGF